MGARQLAYCELHAHSSFSLLDGVPTPQELVERAVALRLPAIALTDHDSVYGLPPFYLHARESHIHPILGAELTMEDDSHLTLLAEDNTGYANLCQLITAGRMSAEKGRARLAWESLITQAKGLICLTGCRRGPVARHAVTRNLEAAMRVLSRLIEIFGRRNVYVELQRNLRRDDIKTSHRLAGLAKRRGLPYVATGNVHYLSPDDAILQDMLVSVRERVPLHKAGGLLRPNANYFLRSAEGMAELFRDLPEAVTRTLEVAERCKAAPPMGLQVLPRMPIPKDQTPDDHLRLLCNLQLTHQYPNRLAEARALLDKELGIIRQLGLANYFLVVWDIVSYCKRHDILCHGRGSAANSIVAKLLGITAVDPIEQALVVERFISTEHGGTPDIDLDIDAMRREEVIQYVYGRWGRDHAAMACTYVTFRSASAIRDAGFALGFKESVIEEIARGIERERKLAELDRDGRLEHADTPVHQLAKQTDQLTSAEWQQLTHFAARLQGRPRHLGLHNGGMVLTGGPIADIVPVEPARMENRTVTQFDKEHLELLGIVKIDLLGLRMLSAIADALAMIRATQGKEIDLYRLDFRDRAVYDRICSAKTIGIFQVESGAQVSIIPAMQPRCYQDLVIEVSLIRPGPLQGGMVRPYVRRRLKQEPVTYLHPLLKDALEETLGVIVFQEQVIKVACDVAGFSPGRGELLRRALGAKNAYAAIEYFHADFTEGARQRGVPPETAERIWQMIAGFAGYSFSKAHAAAFACIVYWSAWLHVHYTTEYFCGLLRSVPLGTYPANVLESEARRLGVKFLPFDINRSQVKPELDNGAIRFGLGYVDGIGDSLAEAIVREREQGPFRSLADFAGRTKLDRRKMESLILAGAFDSLGERRQLVWNLAEAFEIARRPEALPLVVPEEQATFEPMTDLQKAVATFAATGVTGGIHLTQLRRDAFVKAGCIPLAKLKRLRVGTKVRVGGLVADGVRRPPTARGTAFVRLEEPAGMIEILIPPRVYARHYESLRSLFIVVDGVIRSQGAHVNVVANKIERI